MAGKNKLSLIFGSDSNMLNLMVIGVLLGLVKNGIERLRENLLNVLPVVGKKSSVLDCFLVA